MYLYNLWGLFSYMAEVTRSMSLAILWLYKERIPEEDVNISKHVGVFYEIDITFNTLCICWSK